MLQFTSSLAVQFATCLGGAGEEQFAGVTHPIRPDRLVFVGFTTSTHGGRGCRAERVAGAGQTASRALYEAGVTAITIPRRGYLTVAGQPAPLDAGVYAQRHRMENFFQRLKLLVLRADKTASSYPKDSSSLPPCSTASSFAKTRLSPAA